MFRFTTGVVGLVTLVAVAGGGGMVGCARSAGGDGAEQAGKVPAEGQAAAVTRTHIATITEADGQILVEIPLGRDHDMSPGTLLRVLDGDHEGYLKGMLQVLTVAEPQLSLARQIGLMDRQNPLRVDDPVVVIRDVRELNVSGQVRDILDGETEREATRSSTEQEQFAELRRNFQRELQALQERHEAELARLEKQHAATITELEESNKRALKRREAEHLTELSAVREALADEAVTELRRDRDARRAEITRITAKNAELLEQVALLGRELENSVDALRRQEALLVSARRGHEREIRAELETREILEQRIRELEVRLGIPGSRAPAVLVGDVGREETVLARLDRISRERNELLRETESLRSQIASVRVSSADGETDLDEVLKEHGAQLGAELQRTKSRLEALRQQSGGLELARLQAERNFFDLAAAVLRLSAHSPSVKRLQDELREQLSGLTAPQQGLPADEEVLP